MIRHDATFRSDQPMREVLLGVLHWPFWLTLAWTDIRGRYRRTVLGPFWTGLNSLIFICVLAVVYSRLWNIELKDFLPYIASGFYVWGYFTANINECCHAFHSNANTLKSSRISPITMIFRVIARNLIVLAHNLVILIAILIYFGHPPGWTFLLFLPNLIVLSLFCVGIGICLGLACSRFRDIEQLVSSALMILFFVTPILWKPELLPPGSKYLADSNPIYHLIRTVREPLLGIVPPAESVQLSIVFTAVSLAVGLFAYARYRVRLTYWL
ncbi:MAG: ABC transporter permease [Proteobacteria bacterium]|nr:ABC transporter permease [Pseudomonadota bacterium]